MLTYQQCFSCSTIRKVWADLRKELQSVPLPSSCPLEDYKDARGGFHSLSVFDALGRSFITLLRPVLLRAVERVAESSRVLFDSEEIVRFPFLVLRLRQISEDFLERALENTLSRINQLIDQESAC